MGFQIRTFRICSTCPTDAGWSVCPVKELSVAFKVYLYLFSGDNKENSLFGLRFDY